MAKLLETWRNWLFPPRDQFAGPGYTSSKAYMREWRRLQMEALREAQLRKDSAQQTARDQETGRRS